MELLTTDVVRRDGWTVVTARGQLDIATAPGLHQVLAGAQVGPGTAVVLDLQGVEFVDELGLGVLLGALKRARTGAGRFVVVSTRRRFLDLVTATGLDTILEVADDVDGVLAAAGSRS